ncbi:cell wall hydrolase [Peptococcaceae bacterium]|nr:cell wall hydrolase [Peptococcaceae bacterium]
MSRVVMGEIADEPFTGKVAVAAVILNRVDSPKISKYISGGYLSTIGF